MIFMRTLPAQWSGIGTQWPRNQARFYLKNLLATRYRHYDSCPLAMRETDPDLRKEHDGHFAV
jgi:hypothetical protein